MEILSWFGIACIVYIVMAVITFGCIITDMGIEDDGHPLMMVLVIFMIAIACLLSVFWPIYWYSNIKDKWETKK